MDAAKAIRSGVRKFLSTLSTFVIRCSDLVYTCCCRAVVSTVKIGAVQAVLIIGVNEITFTPVM